MNMLLSGHKIIMEKETILKILYYSVRAPSTHNSQPWLFKLNPEGVSVFYDKKLRLPEADKDGRDIFISIGCMLENMEIAASHFGFKMFTEIYIDEKDQHVAEIIFKKSTEPVGENKKIFDQILKRVNGRGKFKDEIISNEIIKKIENLASEFKEYGILLTMLTKKEDINKMAELTQQSVIDAYRRPSFRMEMSHWMNSNLSNKKEGLPGYSLRMPLIISIIIPLVVRYLNIGKFLGKLNLVSVRTAPLIVILSSSNNTKENWIRIGNCAEKMMLSLQAEEFQTSIFVGSIEIGDLYKQVQNVTGLLSDRPQFVFAVGHTGFKHKITPRHELEDKIIK